MLEIKGHVDISIITPSYNMLPYLKRASASIADQNESGLRVKHIVIDGGSTDGTVEWLHQNPKILSISEKDNGMYDAINKGLKLGQGDIFAYLNCDEQYLPGTLRFVKNYFDTHPNVDMIFGDLILIKPDGTLIAFRKGYRPSWKYILTSHLYLLSCTMFFRRQIVENKILFDTRYRAAGDMDFVLRVLESKYNVEHIKRYMAAFTMTGKNMSIDENAIAERKKLLANAPAHIRLLKIPLNISRLTEKFLSGAYYQKSPLEYSIYPEEVQPGDGEHFKRKDFSAVNPSFRWKFD